MPAIEIVYLGLFFHENHMGKRRKTAGKRRRKVRCTLCTPFRWMGNTKGRFRAKDEAEKKDKARLEEYKEEK